MTDKKLTRADLVEALRRECGVRRDEGSKLVDDVLKSIMTGLVQDGEAKLSGFATFTVASKPPRIGRNPKTGEEHPVSVRKVVKFRASHRMKSRVAGAGKK